MNPNADMIVSTTRRINADLIALLKDLKPGERIKLTQTVRIGSRKWPVVVVGIYRGVNYLSTGVTTDRLPEDDIIVPTIHYTKDNGELGSIAIDEHTVVARESTPATPATSSGQGASS